MNCREFEAHLQKRLDGVVEATPALGDRLGDGLAEHLQACAVCRELSVAAKRLERGLSATPRPGVPAGFSERTAIKVLRPARTAFAPRWWLAAAASLFIAGLGALGVRHWLTNWATQPGPVEEVVKARPPSLRQELAQAGDATLRLTRGFAREAADHAGILLPSAERLPTPSSPSLPPRVETTVAPLREAGRTVASGFEPVTHSARRAWGMLVRELPFAEQTTP